MKLSFLNIVLSVLVAGLMNACSDEESLTPRPRGYPRVQYPEKDYRSFDANYCHFTFQYPSYTQIQRDTAFFEEQPADHCWFDVYYPDFDSRIHFSYYPVGPYKSLERLKLDAFEMADWHTKRANYIDEIRIHKPGSEVYGFAFQIEGPAASSFQFYLTDSTDHFVRGALYFNTKARPDSLAPVINFVKEDIDHLIETFEWEGD